MLDLYECPNVCIIEYPYVHFMEIFEIFDSAPKASTWKLK